MGSLINSYEDFLRFFEFLFVFTMWWKEMENSEHNI